MSGHLVVVRNSEGVDPCQIFDSVYSQASRDKIENTKDPVTDSYVLSKCFIENL